MSSTPGSCAPRVGRPGTPDSEAVQQKLQEEIRRLRDAYGTYIESCQAYGIQQDRITTVENRFQPPEASNRHICADPHCNVAEVDETAMDGDESTLRAIADAHHGVHICSKPQCRRRTDKHWFHMRTHVHLDGLVFMLAHFRVPTGSKTYDGHIAAIADALSVHGNVVDVTMNHCGLDDSCLLRLLSSTAQSPRLESLEFFANKIGGTRGFADVARLLPFRTLKALKLAQNNIGERGAVVLASAIADSVRGGDFVLEQLHLHENSIGDVGAAALSNALCGARHLSALGLRKNGITDAGIEHICALVGGGEAVECATCHRVVGSFNEKAYVWRCTCGSVYAVPNRGREPCKEMTCGAHGAKTVRLGCFKKPAGPEGQPYARCEWLCRDCGTVERRGFGAEARRPPSATLQDLQLRDNHIGSIGALAISRALRCNSSLRSLELSNTGIEESGAVQLVKSMMKSSAQISGLNLNDNKVGDEGGCGLAALLGRDGPQHLRTLGLRNNGIGPRGGEPLGAALELNTSLTGLDLGGNQGGDVTARHIARSLQYNTTLRSLDIHDNCIGVEGSLAMAKAFAGPRANNHLTHLDVSDTQTGRKAAAAWARGIAQNSSLVRLALIGCNINLDGTQQIYEALKRENTTLLNCTLNTPKEDPSRANHTSGELRRYLGQRRAMAKESPCLTPRSAGTANVSPIGGPRPGVSPTAGAAPSNASGGGSRGSSPMNTSFAWRHSPPTAGSRSQPPGEGSSARNTSPFGPSSSSVSPPGLPAPDSATRGDPYLGDHAAGQQTALHPTQQELAAMAVQHPPSPPPLPQPRAVIYRVLPKTDGPAPRQMHMDSRNSPSFGGSPYGGSPPYGGPLYGQGGAPAADSPPLQGRMPAAGSPASRGFRLDANAREFSPSFLRTPQSSAFAAYSTPKQDTEPGSGAILSSVGHGADIIMPANGAVGTPPPQRQRPPGAGGWTPCESSGARGLFAAPFLAGGRAAAPGDSDNWCGGGNWRGLAKQLDLPAADDSISSALLQNALQSQSPQGGGERPSQSRDDEEAPPALLEDDHAEDAAGAAPNTLGAAPLLNMGSAFTFVGELRGDHSAATHAALRGTLSASHASVDSGNLCTSAEMQRMVADLDRSN
eukprot:TRINITY_DN27916_c0_g1_i1.p1 TRINITY_DN27916_c0_g1~~TRINITY_DN27916_c0_g1_i1.p1  ORF type:complete len:1176 (+),score=327.44 TRINITY_DN27916_c0_g1_i1:155-3529(+)